MSLKHVSTEQYKITLKSSHGPLQNEQVADYKVRRRQQGRPSGDLASAALTQKYSGPVCIKKAKYDDLMNFASCHRFIIVFSKIYLFRDQAVLMNSRCWRQPGLMGLM